MGWSGRHREGDAFIRLCSNDDSGKLDAHTAYHNPGHRLFLAIPVENAKLGANGEAASHRKHQPAYDSRLGSMTITIGEEFDPGNMN